MESKPPVYRSMFPDNRNFCSRLSFLFKSNKIVSRHGVGYDNVDLKYLNKTKIALAITGSSNAVTVAEHVMAMFLNLCKLSKTSDQLVRR